MWQSMSIEQSSILLPNIKSVLINILSAPVSSYQGSLLDLMKIVCVSCN